MTVITSDVRLARSSSSVFSRSMSSFEQRALAAGDFDILVDPMEVATEYKNLLNLRDRRGGRLVTARGGTLPTLTALNGRLGVQGNDVGGHMRVDYQLPSSYFVAAAFRTGTDFSTTNAIISSATQAGDRMLFGTIGSKLSLLHGGSFPLNATTEIAPSTDYVAWATFDAETMAAAIGVNAVTPEKALPLPILHKGEAQTNFFGGEASWGFDAQFGPAVVSSGFLGGSIHEARRAAILAWLGETVGVGIGA